MIDRKHELSISRQAHLMGLSRGIVYYLPKPVSPEDLELMRRIDELHLEFPFAGSRMLRDLLNRERRLMKRMGIEALYRKPNTSKAGKGHKIYPYLLRNRVIDRPNQVWAMDITYLPMAKGLVYLCAVVDWVSRKILSHRISISMDTSFCLDALEEAFEKYGKPEIFNTDQRQPIYQRRFYESTQ
ncbi:MAG: putative transposase [Cellvibrionaceae bacterium]|jgi:putative transposase